MASVDSVIGLFVEIARFSMVVSNKGASRVALFWSV